LPNFRNRAIEKLDSNSDDLRAAYRLLLEAVRPYIGDALRYLRVTAGRQAVDLSTYMRRSQKNIEENLRRTVGGLYPERSNRH